ncbi:MAG: ABC transporter permease subunit [Treponema sp.]|jgi:ABC-2 type transport system permease protein|nr:ABC transporter permease subunit [Treponema sp.]
MKIFSPRALALMRKELYSALYAPATYGIALFFLLFVSIWFFYLQRFFAMDTATLRPFFSAFPLAFILVIPVITMKAWAEERKLGSVELLLTMPFSEWELVLGKFLSSFVILLSFLILTLPVPLSLLPLGDFDPGVIAGEYAGAVFLGASATSLGIFLSSLAKNQGGAFLGSAVVLMAVMLLNQLTLQTNLPEALTGFINFVSLSFHFESFSRGLLDSRDLAFFILTTVLFLFLNTQVVIYRKWR